MPIISSINHEQGGGIVLRTITLELVSVCYLCCLWTATSSILLHADPNNCSAGAVNDLLQVNLRIELSGAMMIRGF